MGGGGVNHSCKVDGTSLWTMFISSTDPFIPDEQHSSVPPGQGNPRCNNLKSDNRTKGVMTR